ncbi:MAG: metabolite traffic protein EboE [Granulosicoccus sp.]
MEIDNHGNPTHLGYCTNIHAGDDWATVFEQLKTCLPKVRAGLDLIDPMGIGLRLSMQHLEALEQDDTFTDFQRWLQDNNHNVFTLNGFPYGAFHGVPVKEQVYRPDWTNPARLDYTCRLATLHTRLAPPEDYGSISTLPGTFKAWALGQEALIAEQLLQTVAHCVSLERDTGITIAIALEPEPCCLLETVDDTIQFFASWLQSDAAIARLSTVTRLSAANAREALYTHLGVCHDVCHSAVEFEDPLRAIARLQGAGINIIKLQLSSALRITNVDETALKQLARFDEPVYLHQVVEQIDEELNRYTDLGDARIAFESSESGNKREWRVHFHVPVFIEQLEHFGTTQSVLAELLNLQQREGICRHLEVETYTWDVLPETYRNVEISEAIARELDWVRERL